MRISLSNLPTTDVKTKLVWYIRFEHNISKVRSGDQCLLGDSVTEVKLRRARLVPGWVTAREDWALLTCVRSSVWTLICDRPSK